MLFCHNIVVTLYYSNFVEFLKKNYFYVLNLFMQYYHIMQEKKSSQAYLDFILDGTAK